MQDFQQELNTKGYTIIPDVLNKRFKKQKICLKNGEKQLKITTGYIIISTHMVFINFNEVGHQEHAWFIRTRPEVQKYFKQLWKTDDLIVSFDGSCYISETCKKKDKIWTHTDQCANNHNLECYQGFASLTHNKERTLIVYEGSHLLHEKYFNERGLTGTKNWELIEHDYLKEIADRKRVLEIPAGALVIWDSRTFHQNQFGKPNSEERMVQYVCYLPRNHKKNTKSNQAKRIKYFQERRTTSHWPCSVKVNGKQPISYGNPERIINYEKYKVSLD